MDPIDVFALAQAGTRWSGTLAFDAMPRLCTSLMNRPGDRAGQLHFHCHSHRDARGRPALRLGLQARLPLVCDRCGDVLALDLTAERDFYFVATESELAAIPIDDTPEEALLGSARFDLAELIEDEAILQLPISPRHVRCAPRALAKAVRAAAPAAERPHPFAGLAGLREQLRGADGLAVPSGDGPAAPETAETARKRPGPSG